MTEFPGSVQLTWQSAVPQGSLHSWPVLPGIKGSVLLMLLLPVQGKSSDRSHSRVVIHRGDNCSCLMYSAAGECPCCPSCSVNRARQRCLCVRQCSHNNHEMSRDSLLWGCGWGRGPSRYCLVAVVVVFSFYILSSQWQAPDSAGAHSAASDAWEDEFSPPVIPWHFQK